MRGEKTIDLGFDIKVSVGGEYVHESEVTVRAPGLDKFQVHTKMQAYVGKALAGIAGMRGQLQDAAQDTNEDEQDTNKDEQDVMVLMSMGMSGDDYTEFAAFARKSLTNSKLASVGENAKLTDEAWLEIEAQGGMEAVMRILSAFTDFFFDALASKPENGKGKSLTSASHIKGRSTKKKPEPTPG
ncbi:MAG: hypothetical protein RIC14_01195 [Filomicrobium sp.]